MKAIKNSINRMVEASDFFEFLWKLKLWFIIPFFVILIIFAFIFIFAQATGVAPFIYTLF